MTVPATPRVSRRPTLPLIWVVPLVALVIAGWMLARQFRDRGPEITIEFQNGVGIEAGKTEVEHKGVSVGLVKEVSLKPDLSGVRTRIRLAKAGSALAREGSEFWIVQPEVSWAGVRGLETLVNGVRIKVRPGQGVATSHFRGLERPPAMDDSDAGRAFILHTDRLRGLSPGAPVYYRDVKVGSIEATRLADDARSAEVRVRIYNPYVALVRTNSQFWNVTGVSLKLGLGGAELRTNTLQSLIAGGVCFASPGGPDATGAPALEGTHYTLHAEPSKEWLAWRPGIPVNPVESGRDSSKTDAAASPAPAMLGATVSP